MFTLYLVATPIGNLEDITLRALRVLREVSLVAAEDTRTTRKLLSRHGIHTPLTSFYDDRQRPQRDRLLRALEEGDVALVSEAGMPTLSDPGQALVREAIEREVPVVAVPGPSAVPTALAVSGLSSEQFLYLGYLPRRKGPRRELLSSVANEGRTVVAFEAPRRLRATLQDALECLGERRVAVCRELTKLHEEVFRGTLSEALEHFGQPRGEFTLVIEGAPRVEPEVEPETVEELRQLRAAGVSAREATARVAQKRGSPRRLLYEAWLKIARES